MLKERPKKKDEKKKLCPLIIFFFQNLHDSLDTRASKTSAVKVKLHRADPTHAISKNNILIGLALSVFGAGIYYVLPLSLLSMVKERKEEEKKKSGNRKKRGERKETVDKTDSSELNQSREVD